MGTPEQDYSNEAKAVKYIQYIWVTIAAVVAFVGWVYNGSADLARWKAQQVHDKEALSVRLEAIEAHARLHKAGQHARTQKQRVKDVRQMIKQIEAVHVELVKLVPGKRRNRVRDELRRRLDKLTDALIGD